MFGSLVIVGIIGRFIKRDCILRDVEHLAAKQTVSAEVEGIDFDFGILPGSHEANVTIEHHGLDLELTVARHNVKQCLRRRYDAADRMYRELLDRAILGRRQELQLGAALGFDKILAEVARLTLCLNKLAEAGSSIFRLGLRP